MRRSDPARARRDAPRPSVAADARDAPTDDARTPAERALAERLAGTAGIGRPLSDRARQTQRSAEAYLAHSAPPRWMERVIEIDSAIERERRWLARAWRRLREECGDDAGRFAARWRAIAAGRDYRELNELIREHNEWYPVERDLPLDPRTGDYVTLHGRSYRRPLLDAAWVLEQFPPSPGAGAVADRGGGAAADRGGGDGDDHRPPGAPRRHRPR